MATLSEITELDPKLLEEKFNLEPRIRYDPSQSENLLFLSPLILLEDLELKAGGFQDRGAKEVLSRVAKHICESKDPSLLQVPEITYFYMGYGKKSVNKKCQMAINKEEAEVWMGFLNLSRFTREKNPEEGVSTSVEEGVPMEIDDIDFPTPRDTQALEDTQQVEFHDSEDSVGPNDSGLKIPLKGSYVLLFSILLIFFDKKKQKMSENSTDDEPNIGANKVSDLLLFWIIPYLLNYSHRKVSEIVEHHKRANGRSFSKTVKISSLKIIEDALSSCQVSPELQRAIKTKYKDFYGSEQLEHEYNLLATRDDEPVILVPKRYKVSKMPAELEDIGKSWRKLGDVKLIDEFMSKFIKDKEIQKDFFYSLPRLANRQGVDYAILFPDERTFSEVIENLEKESAEYFTCPKHFEKEGRNLITSRIGLVKNTEKNLAVAFSYFQGTVPIVCITTPVYVYKYGHWQIHAGEGLCIWTPLPC